MRLFFKFILLYSAILAIFISSSGFKTTKGFDTLIPQIIFLPVTLFLIYAVFGELKVLKNGDKNAKGQKGVKQLGVIILVFFVFLILTSVSAIKIWNNTTPVSVFSENVGSTPQKYQSAKPSESTAESAEIASSPMPKIRVVIADGSEKVNLRSSATKYSDIVGSALDGDTYDLVSKDKEWYQIKLEDGKFAWIFFKYVKAEENK